MLTTKMSSAIWTHLSTYTHKSATLASKFPQRTALEWLKSKSTGRQDYFIFRHSGVGKSTLINSILPGIEAKTGEISSYHNKGMHTTTFSEMFPVEGDGYIIDTPGIKGFGTFDMEEEEIGHYFPEIFKTSADCKYGNCTHRHEPGCAVRKAVEEHLISESRYTSYLNMLEDKEEEISGCLLINSFYSSFL